jgi:hypothetical protein
MPFIVNPDGEAEIIPRTAEAGQETQLADGLNSFSLDMKEAAESIATKSTGTPVNNAETTNKRSTADEIEAKPETDSAVKIEAQYEKKTVLASGKDVGEKAADYAEDASEGKDASEKGEHVTKAGEESTQENAEGEAVEIPFLTGRVPRPYGRL